MGFTDENNQKRVPAFATHPGMMIIEEWRARGGKHLELFARELNVPFDTLLRIIQGEVGIDQSFADKLALAWGVPSEYFMKLQANYQADYLAILEAKRLKLTPQGKPIPRRSN